VQPRAVFRREVGHPLDRVEVARVDLTGVRDDDRRAVELPQPGLQALCVKPSRRVASEALDVALAHAEHADRLYRARVDVAAREDRRRGEG
jgi:hypothetical protein